MKIITFKLMGKMAHFRKFYSNSSSLSYFIPPRTTLAGMIAGLLGYSRDTYYEEFSLSTFKVALSVAAPIKKTMQKVNNLMIKSANDLNGSAEYHSQTAMEFVIPHNIRSGFLTYQVWLYHENPQLMERIERVLISSDGLPFYRSLGTSLSLGTAFTLGWIDDAKIIEGSLINGTHPVKMNSVLPMKKVKEICVKEMVKETYFLIKEEVPLEFDSNRRITENGLGNIVINLSSHPVPVMVDTYIALETGELITWME